MHAGVGKLELVLISPRGGSVEQKKPPQKIRLIRLVRAAEVRVRAKAINTSRALVPTIWFGKPVFCAFLEYARVEILCPRKMLPLLNVKMTDCRRKNEKITFQARIQTSTPAPEDSYETASARCRSLGPGALGSSALAKWTFSSETSSSLPSA